MSRLRLLVTGFGPFPTMPRNPSAALARRVVGAPRWRLVDIDVACLTLTTAYRALDDELAPALATGFDAILMIGVAGRSARIRVEARATSRRSTLFADVEGAKAARPARSFEPPALRIAIAPAKLLRPLRAERLPARISRNAGRYLCNAAYHRALASGTPAAFIHIPKRLSASRPRARRRERLDPDTRLRDALVAGALLLVRKARRAGR